MHFRTLMTAATLLSILSVSCSTIGIGSGGSRELLMTASPDVPGAEGRAKVSTTDNGNTKIELVVKHLAPPENVDPGATVYVVWARGSENYAEPQNLGALKVDSNLNGNISAATNLRSFDLFVTAEPSQSTTRPTGRMLLETNVVMKSVNEN